MCALWRVPLLLYAYLEAEDWPADGSHRDAASPHALRMTTGMARPSGEGETTTCEKEIIGRGLTWRVPSCSGR